MIELVTEGVDSDAFQKAMPLFVDFVFFLGSISLAVDVIVEYLQGLHAPNSITSAIGGAIAREASFEAIWTICLPGENIIDGKVVTSAIYAQIDYDVSFVPLRIILT